MSANHELLAVLLRDVHRGLGLYFRETLEAFDFTLPMLIISNRIKVQPGITVSELARQTGFAKSHVSNVIKDMEQKGWVDKLADEADQRLLRLQLNSHGTDHLQAIGGRIRTRLNDLVADMPDEKADALVDGLKDISDALHRQQKAYCQHGPKEKQT